uniref:Uncharacterized protein n=1 Tax=Romanomermis culicivorax TaxID=13658 RepID=A0A915L3H5_ROMCU
MQNGKIIKQNRKNNKEKNGTQNWRKWKTKKSEENYKEENLRIGENVRRKFLLIAIRTLTRTICHRPGRRFAAKISSNEAGGSLFTSAGRM